MSGADFMCRVSKKSSGDDFFQCTSGEGCAIVAMIRHHLLIPGLLMAHIELPRALEDYFAFAETTPTRNGRRFVITLPISSAPAPRTSSIGCSGGTT